MLYNICVDIYIHLSGYNLKIIKFIIQAILDFLMKQQLITLNANCNLIQCTGTHITDFLANLKGLLDSMIIKVFNVMQIVSCSEMCQNHQTFISCSLLHNFHMCNNNYIIIYTCRTLLDIKISHFPNLHYWLPLLKHLGTVKLSFLKHSVRDFLFRLSLVEISYLRQIQHQINLSFFMIVVAVLFLFFSVFCSVFVTNSCSLFCFYYYKTFL